MDITNYDRKQLEYNYYDLRRLFMRGAVMSYKTPSLTLQRMEELFNKEMDKLLADMKEREERSQDPVKRTELPQERRYDLKGMTGASNMVCASCGTTGCFTQDDEGTIRCDCGSERYRILPEDDPRRE
jgi:hypothetical protein